MGYDLSNSRRWIVPHGGEQREVLRVANAAGVILWEKYYRVSYEANSDGMQYWIVYFNANGGSGSMSPLQVPKGSSVPLPACAFSRAGCALKAQQYNTAANGSGASYSAGGSLTPTANMTLYAQWQANSYTISFNPGGGSGSMSPTTAAYGSTVTLPACAFTRSGHAFDLWECTIGGEESYFEDQDMFVMPAQNLSLTAQWEETDPDGIYIVTEEDEIAIITEGSGENLTTEESTSFIITLNANGNTSTWPGISPSFSDGQLTASIEAWYGLPYPTIPAPTAPGYTFKNWYDGTAGTHFPDGVQIAGNVAVASARTFWAQWTANTYTVTVSPGTGGTGGTGFTYSMSGSSQAKTITPPTRTGYKITAWTFTGYTGTVPSASGSTVTVPANTYGNITMTPTWSEDYITITFNSNGGS